MLREIWKLNPNRDWASRLATLWHNVWLMLETAIFATVITGIWMTCYTFKWPFHTHHEADLIMINTVILLCAAIFAFVAGTLFGQVRSRNAELAQAALFGEEAKFMAKRDEKIQIMMHAVTGFFGASMLFLSGIVEYSSIWVGGTVIFFESAVIMVYFISMFEMQDVSKNVWICCTVPKHWIKQPSAEYFKKHRAELAKTRESAPQPEVRTAA
ncbi:MAG: hypothetical protein V4474_03425 [Patescibacteria group bacterium]